MRAKADKEGFPSLPPLATHTISQSLGEIASSENAGASKHACAGLPVPGPAEPIINSLSEICDHYEPRNEIAKWVTIIQLLCKHKIDHWLHFEYKDPK